MRTLIVSGAGRYADPWHPFAKTSVTLAEVLGAAGGECTVDEDVEGALIHASEFDLVVVNAGDPWRTDDVAVSPLPAEASVDGFARALDAGTGVLALHCATASLRGYPQWAPALGRVWLPTVSFHPPADVATITGGTFPDGEAARGFDVFDERYCRLQPVGVVHPVATHRGPAGDEPTAWVNSLGASRIAVDLLGHDEQSYESAGHRRLLTQLAAWVVRR